MKIRKKSPKEIAILKEGGKILVEALFAAEKQAQDAAEKQVSTWDLNETADRILRTHDAIPAFLNYEVDKGLPFPASLCVSVNDEIVHGIPRKDRILQEGDVVAMDLGVIYKKLFTDACVTVVVGKGSETAKKITNVAHEALAVGLGQMHPGAALGDYGHVVDKFVIEKGFVTAKGLGGHGVGYGVHEPPFIPNQGSVGKGLKLEEGMVLALEPIINEKTEHIELDFDSITFKTIDGGLSAQFEHTVAITKNGHEIITKK